MTHSVGLPNVCCVSLTKLEVIAIQSPTDMLLVSSRQIQRLYR